MSEQIAVSSVMSSGDSSMVMCSSHWLRDDWMQGGCSSHWFGEQVLHGKEKLCCHQTENGIPSAETTDVCKLIEHLVYSFPRALNACVGSLQ
jgi:hypothetical protein